MPSQRVKETIATAEVRRVELERVNTESLRDLAAVKESEEESWRVLEGRSFDTAGSPAPVLTQNSSLSLSLPLSLSLSLYCRAICCKHH
jgi:hypothetical protein